MAEQISTVTLPVPYRVCLAPPLLRPETLTDQTVVVVDVLRATTSMLVALQAGATHIRPVSAPEDLAALRDYGYLTAAERDGSALPGFDFGNSPQSFNVAHLSGRNLAMSTTNGTAALHAAASAAEVLIGAFANLSALGRYLLTHQRPVTVLCAGWKGDVNLEDTAFAGALLEGLAPIFSPGNEAANLAHAAYREFRRRPVATLLRSVHRRRIRAIGAEQDVRFALQVDTCPLLARFAEGKVTAFTF